MRSASGYNNMDDRLQNWFDVINSVKNQSKAHRGAGMIPNKLRDRIEAHFRYFWENDRTFVLFQRSDYFETIPKDIQYHIVVNFLFEDILKENAFSRFFRLGQDFDNDFIFDICFGFMPR